MFNFLSFHPRSQHAHGSLADRVGRLMRVVVIAGWIGFVGASQGSAQAPAPVKDPSTLEGSKFAPGVLRLIPPAPTPEETFRGPLTLQALLDTYPEIQFGGETHPEGKPHFDPRSRTLAEMAKEVILRREIYCFEFAFKPLRHIYIDVPTPSGRTQRKLIWYMVYRVRYRGGDLRPAADMIAGVPIFKRVEEVHYNERHFLPMMVLRDHKADQDYVDTILPTAAAKIRVREQITAPVYNTVQISRVKIPFAKDASSPGVWGVSTWEDVDPGLDFGSVEVTGLTNSFEQDGEGDDAPYRRKVLQLNFFRPGDRVNQTDDLIRFGVPAFADEKEQAYILKQYGLEERLDYRWLFK